MRIFITGAGGFIGSFVARKLVNSGHDIVCLGRASSRFDRIDDLPFVRVLGDVRDVESLRAAMAGCDHTIHLAAPGAWEQDDPRLLADVLEGGTRNVLNVAAALENHRVVVVSSTAAIACSDTPIVFDERNTFSVPDQNLYYAFAKHRAETIAAEAFMRGVAVIVVNPAEVYGPDDTALVTAGNLVDLATSTPVLVSDGGTCVVHVEDVAVGIIAALERGRPGERYILGGENVTIRELAMLVLELTGRRAPIVSVPRWLVRLTARIAIRLNLKLSFNPHVVPYATWYWFVDSAKARTELGVCFRGARDTIADALAWLERTGQVKARSPERDRSA
ncbi:MAG: NAD-dependent epimerase/dehydratase family protein [Gemmatimonadaceae bacterium]